MILLDASTEKVVKELRRESRSHYEQAFDCHLKSRRIPREQIGGDFERGLWAGWSGSLRLHGRQLAQLANHIEDADAYAEAIEMIYREEREEDE